MNINCIVFINGSIIWITPEEYAGINFHLLRGEKFIEVPRLRQTYNTGSIAYIGANMIFFEKEVKDAEFSFAPGRIFARLNEVEYEYIKKWKRSNNTFSLGKPFDEYIKSQAVETGEADPLNKKDAVQP